jgi:hypothetical protein
MPAALQAVRAVSAQQAHIQLLGHQLLARSVQQANFQQCKVLQMLPHASLAATAAAAQWDTIETAQRDHHAKATASWRLA